MNFLKGTAMLALAWAALASCGGASSPTSRNPGTVSTATGIAYSDDETEERLFVISEYAGQPIAPGGTSGMIFVQGGRTVLGSPEQDVAYSRDNIERTVTIQSFYMDETEVANIHWKEYLHYLKVDSLGKSPNPDIVAEAVPDTTVWVKRLSYNDPYRDHYFSYPGFRFYPVVGVSWEQANKYCIWRSNMVNYNLAVEARGEDYANEKVQNLGRIPLESGFVVPDYRLPSEAEWEYAAVALIGQQYDDENHNNRRLYPWDGHALRNPYGNEMGLFLANFKRGRGDYGGIAGKINDGAMITSQVYDFPPNDFGLYNMAGNVNEWVWDVYRPKSFQDFEDLNPVRRDDYRDLANAYDPKYSLISHFTKEDPKTGLQRHPRVYKGGSWADVAYWLSPGNRRYFRQDSSSATIGFRCAMVKAGTDDQY